MKQYGAAVLTAVSAAVLLTGCGGDSPKPNAQSTANTQSCCDLSTAKDGTYTARSTADELGSGQITIVIKNHKIVASDFVGMDPDGKIKDETYGMTNGEITDKNKYKTAQSALKANNSYAAQLLETQKLSDVDAIAGATVSHQQFMEAGRRAIAQSKK